MTTKILDTIESHAYHLNLPEEYFDDDGVSVVTKYAQSKADTFVNLAYSIQLPTDLYLQTQQGIKEEADEETEASRVNLDVKMSTEQDPKDELEFDFTSNPKTPNTKPTVKQLIQMCNRLLQVWIQLQDLKHYGMEQMDLCRIVLHLLKLVSATVNHEKKICFEHVGFVYDTLNEHIVHHCDDGTMDSHNHSNHDELYVNCTTQEMREYSFALPAPAREALLAVVVNIVTKDCLLQSVSNRSFSDPEPQGLENSHLLLVIEWKVMLRMLLRTAPYLDEYSYAFFSDKESPNKPRPPSESQARQSVLLKRTVLMIRYLRRFYNQGLKVKSGTFTNQTSEEVWEMISDDIMYKTHSCACYRALIFMYLFIPSRNSTEFYLSKLGTWLDCWTNIDRCPDYDYLFLTLFCRARKYVTCDHYDWGPIRQRLLTLCAYWLQIPVGGQSNDKSFPNANQARSRSIPSRLKSFVGISNGYTEGMHFVSKLSKLLVFCIGKNDQHTETETDIESAPKQQRTNLPTADGTEDILRFLSFISPYFHPSNTGVWTFPLGILLHDITNHLCLRLAKFNSQRALEKVHPLLASTVVQVEPYQKDIGISDHEIVLLMDALLPLCQQALYSKSPRVARAGEASLMYLAQIDHKICPQSLDFAMRALDVSSINMSHQAPAALSLLSRLVAPSLKRNPSFFLERLPQMLSLTLAGIDSNDQDKTLRTLIFYRTVTSWIPIGDVVQETSSRGTMTHTSANSNIGGRMIETIDSACESDSYWDALKRLPKTSILYQAETSYMLGKDSSRLDSLLEEAKFAMGDWLLAFLEKIYDLMRAAGEQEKRGKSHGVASNHSSVDASQAKHFNSVLKQCLSQVSASMDDDNFEVTLRSTAAFLTNEVLPFAAKYASILSEAICAARFCKSNCNSSPGLKFILPLLLNDIQHQSQTTVVYRLRCAAGAVRRAGKDVLLFQEQLHSALQFALYHPHKYVHKVGCKLLRHLMSSQCESYPLSTEFSPITKTKSSLGRSSKLSDQKIIWHVPNQNQIEYVSILWSTFIYNALTSLVPMLPNDKVDIVDWRKNLKMVRYALRGSSRILLELDATTIDTPSAKLLQSISSEKTAAILMNTRGSLADFVAHILSHIKAVLSSKNVENLESTKNLQISPESSVALDPKICKEVSEIALLIFSRRGEHARCGDYKTVWKMQKDIQLDQMLHATYRDILSIFNKCSRSTSPLSKHYKDGEEYGKSIPRRLVLMRIQIFLNEVRKDYSFEIPRNMKKHSSLQQKHIINEKSLSKVYDCIQKRFASYDLIDRQSSNLPIYQDIFFGSINLSSHSNATVRGRGARLFESILSRFGWFAVSRIDYLLSTISLTEPNIVSNFSHILASNDSSIKPFEAASRKHLSEILKGAAGLLSTSRVMKAILLSEDFRFTLIKSMCQSQKVISTLPAEEVQKMVHYFHTIYSKLRPKYYHIHPVSQHDIETRDDCLRFLLKTICDDKSSQVDALSDGIHWKDRMISIWFLFTFIEKEDISMENDFILMVLHRIFNVIEQDIGQPTQKSALGLFGRVITLFASNKIGSQSYTKLLGEKCVNFEFCSHFVKALVSNHKEDNTIGGGHVAQWSTGVEQIIKDAQANNAPKIIFPFKRAGRSSSQFLLHHAQLVSEVLLQLNEKHASDCAILFYNQAIDLVSAAPSEDQKNQIYTAAELFAGVSHGLLVTQPRYNTCDSYWNENVLPFFEKIIKKVPSSFLNVYSDALRFIIRDASSEQLEVPLKWIVAKMEASLWQEENVSASHDPSTYMEGFAEQSKWIGLICAVLAEMDLDFGCSKHWTDTLSRASPTEPAISSISVLVEGWNTIIYSRLVPCLLNAIGHPFQTCREQIAWCLFRTSNCFQNLSRQMYMLSKDNNTNIRSTLSDPTNDIIEVFKRLDPSYLSGRKEQQHGLITLRLFMSFCLHYGDSKNEYASFLIPLLPTAFEAVRPAEGEQKHDTNDLDSEVRMLRSQVAREFRYALAEISASCFVTYHASQDVSRVLNILDTVSKHEVWQVRNVAAHFVRCFQGCHKFLFTDLQTRMAQKMILNMLADERKEVSNAAMSALTGFLASCPSEDVADMVENYIQKANSVIQRKRKKDKKKSNSNDDQDTNKHTTLPIQQQTSVYFLCAAVLSRPYDTPAFTPKALAALSKHSYERNASFVIRETVKLCCREYKKTHMTDNWDLHRMQFTQEELEALDDVISTPHYYA